MNSSKSSLLVTLIAAATLANAADPSFTSQFPIADCHFSTFGGNAHFILNPGHQLVLSGEEDGEANVLTITALNQTKEITLTNSGPARKILTRVIEERKTVDGELYEVSRNWYARCIETGDIYYFGEEVDFYENGMIIGHSGAWQAGSNGALPGIIMPGTFLLGARYFQEIAPGVATDQGENTAMGLRVTNAAGVFVNCVSVTENNPLAPGSDPETKTYAPGIGLISDDGILTLEEFRLGTQGFPVDCTFVPFSHHPYFPFAPGRRLVFLGEEHGEHHLDEVTVLNETKQVSMQVGGETRFIQTRVIEHRETVDGELAEITRDFYAQCLESGDVYYFGEEVDVYDDGMIVSHGGSWLAGVSNALPGIIMPGNFTIGARYSQERAPGVAEDAAETSATGVSMTVPAGTFTGCVTVTETNPLEPGSDPEEKTYAPGIGLINDAGILELTEFIIPGMANAPILAIENAVVLSWPLTDDAYRLEMSTDLSNWFPILPNPLPVDGRFQTSVSGSTVQKFFRLATP
jgi:hypothetical protein